MDRDWIARTSMETGALPASGSDALPREHPATPATTSTARRRKQTVKGFGTALVGAPVMTPGKYKWAWVMVKAAGGPNRPIQCKDL
jgi:hypothetical protein